MGESIHSELEIISHDGLTLYGQIWQPSNFPKALILLSHGLSDRSERFTHWAEKFVHHDYAFCCFDTRGNGKSGGKRGHCNSFDDFLLDIDFCLKEVEIRFPKIPVILYGHSMGGNVIANYLLRRKPKVKAAIITSPWLKLANEPNFLLRFLAQIACRIAPGIEQKANIKAHHLTDNPEVVAQYIADPLIHDRITPAGFINIQKAGLWAIENADKLAVPILLMQENGDRITSFSASEEFAARAGTNCHFKAWEGLFHELHNEPFQDEVFKYIIEWLEFQ
ncbi:MAG: lysophospholipase [Bacteroidales bacterium]|nr:lysophospholipase [Bacteroidales bacterium]MCF8456669.1 lysophospholipase [Bacteroidales bacterium]